MADSLVPLVVDDQSFLVAPIDALGVEIGRLPAPYFDGIGAQARAIEDTA